jgi:uncharacterized protein (DUF488 family)
VLILIFLVSQLKSTVLICSKKKMVNLFTIGFTKKNAEEFFGILTEAEVSKIVDIRLNNSSQLSGFAKRQDLEYFLRVICNIQYVHLLDLAPTQELLDDYKNRKATKMTWNIYAHKFEKLMNDRQIKNKFLPDFFDKSCLLCSEPSPLNCHRRLVAEHLKESWENVAIKHL